MTKPNDNDKATAALVRATKRVRAQTSIGRLEKLQAEQTRWLRRSTFARNKLAGIRAEIESLASTLAEEKFAGELDSISGNENAPTKE